MTQQPATNTIGACLGGLRLHPISQVAIAKKIKIDNKS
jgi:hypothetical protein